MLGLVGPDLEDHVLLHHANKANTLGLLVDEVAQSHHERLLGEATYVHECLVEVRCMSVGLLGLFELSPDTPDQNWQPKFWCRIWSPTG
jgi:hypothetical protein